MVTSAAALGALPAETHPALRTAATAALAAYGEARAGRSRAELAETVADGADGTPTMLVDVLVESAILTALADAEVNVLSEETGFVDRRSAVTLVMDPLDGSANAAAGVPLTAFGGAVAVDGEFTEGLIVWLDTGRTWWAARDRPTPLRTSGRKALSGAAVSLLRPRFDVPGAAEAWRAVAERAGRVRILSSSCLEAALVADGSTDAFADAGGDVHRLVDVAASVVLAEAAGGAVRDVRGRPIECDTDLTRRWSGVVAATPDLADEIAETVRAAAGL
ncbi:inositol monophosphatase family protein [Spongiactinospora sp. TRM90649]|uniref:inositol monophosphatase family protein n=1 Tax=Spongiactinospora sp. TRM90649 TaxID=3031114 RepID=UPI0023F7D404|nr:inositol monophosphatase family protein [Spongiactinospora sp. TRM90649]MDF5757067.1 inositol monophosphatase family protein [Spongiactinospora sp. TRM90649]